MKKIFILLILLAPSLLFAQVIASQAVSDPFTVMGKIANVNAPARAYLFYQFGATKIIDSAEIINGEYSFTGKVLYPETAYLMIDHNNVGIARLTATRNAHPEVVLDLLNFYLERGILFVDSKDSVINAKISGSKLNTENAELQTSLKVLEQPIMKLNMDAQAASPEQQKDVAFKNTMQARSKVLQNQQIGILKNFIISHPDSYLSIIIMNQLGPHVADPKELDPLYNSLSVNLKNSEPGKSLSTAIDHAKITGLGAIAPDFTQNDASGNPVSLSSFRGKYVLIDFWASWCGPCREENPNLVRTYNKYKDKNFTVLGVSLDRPDGKSDWLKAIRDDGLTWTQVSDLNFWSNKVAVTYFIGQIPSNFLIDPKGKIIARDLRGQDLEYRLEQELGQK